MNFCVYALIDDKEEPYYIGQTMYYENRINLHKSRLKKSPQKKYIKARELLKKGFPLTAKILFSGLTKEEATNIETTLVKTLPNLTNRRLNKKLHPSNIKHGKAYTKAYRAWCNMRHRCSDKNRPDYYLYGGRGISVCAEWQVFLNFLKDMGDPPTPKHSLDRINNNGNYEPNNCRWATSSRQARNTRGSHQITYNGKTQCMIDWSEELGMSWYVLRARLQRGWSVNEAFETPLKSKPVLLIHNGKTQTIRQWAKELNIHPRTIRERLSYKWPIEKVLTPKKERL